MTSDARIVGYDYGNVPRSPVTIADLRRLEATCGFTDEDRKALLSASEILADQAEALVDGWRAIIGSQDHLARWFFDPDGEPDERYKAAVKPRFVQWVVDLCTRPFDQAWLDYQYEIGLRHTPDKKNMTDGVATPPLVPLRYLMAFIPPVLQSVDACLHASDVSPAEADRMSAAWTKAVVLTVTLWTLPYVKDELW
jgi:hypothetical protein